MKDFTFHNPVTAVMGEAAVVGRVSSREFTVDEYAAMAAACGSESYLG